MTTRLLPPALGLASMAAVAVICVLSLVPGNERPHTGAPGQVEHFIAYCLTGAVLALRLRSRRTGIILGLVVLAGVLETGQIWVPGRTAQVVDFLASSAGAVTGTLLAGAALVRWPTLGRLA
ncbi:VanZ family protein [uncultured Methylobacterium sp.]|jgi:VanZ family protein|uniref:VanZ family protein n=1 Tax=uncultured Methylobacterium sp. TaxID=157278 RepID=UPI00260856BC|nr:VanZ family protein [uncultured Methylobacterium sp.]